MPMRIKVNDSKSSLKFNFVKIIDLYENIIKPSGIFRYTGSYTHVGFYVCRIVELCVDEIDIEMTKKFFE